MTDTPARDALFNLLGGWVHPDRLLDQHGRSVVLAALVEAHGLDACFEALGGTRTDAFYGWGIWSFPTKETTDE